MKRSRLFWGLAIISAGVLLLLGALGIGEQYGLLRIAATIFLVGIAIESLYHLHFLLFFVPVAVAAYLWRNQLGLPNLSLGLLVAAAALLGIGLSVVFRRSSLHGFSHHVSGQHTVDWNQGDETMTADETLSLDVSFGEQIKRVHASRLKRLEVASNFAKTVVIFEDTQLAAEGLRVLINGNFTEIVLVMPRMWTADSSLHAFAGTVKGLPARTGPAQANVRLSGNIHFGEVRIEYL